MKTILAMALLSLSVSSFASTVDQAIKKVEAKNSARCSATGASTLAQCFGIPKTCFYSLKFSCENNEGVFGVKLKVKDVYNFDTAGYRTVVRKTIITR